MGKRKWKVLFFVLLILTWQLLLANISESNIKSYNRLYELQLDPKNLEYALDCALSTVIYAVENFPSQDIAEKLLERIYTKIELFEEFGKDDHIIKAIIKESTDDLLSVLQTLPEETAKYTKAYNIMGFVLKDFSELINTFHFENFKRYFNLNKLKNFKLIEMIDGKQLQSLTNKIIDTIIENDYYLNSTAYSGIIKLGKEKFLNYLSIQINPYLDKKNIETLGQQYSLLKTYINLYQNFYGDQFQKKVPRENYIYFIELEKYYNYLSNVEIMSRRLLTAEEQTLGTLFPVFFNYIKDFQNISLKTEKLNDTVLKMIKNASTRFSYDKSELLLEKYDLSELSVSNEEINESLKNLFSLIKTKTPKKETTSRILILGLFQKPLFIISATVLIALLILFIMILPLKIKGAFYKNIGLLSKALTLFEKAAIKYPMDADIHIKTAQIYEKLGREEEAMNEYKIASKVIDMKED